MKTKKYITSKKVVLKKDTYLEVDIQAALSSFPKEKFSAAKWTSSIARDFGLVTLLSAKISRTIAKLITTHILSSFILQYYKRINSLLAQSYRKERIANKEEMIKVLEKREKVLTEWLESDLTNVFEPLLQVNFTRTPEEVEEFVDICYSSYYMLKNIEETKLKEHQLVLFDIPYQFQNNLKNSPVLPNVIYEKKMIISDNSSLLRACVSKPQRDGIYQFEATCEWK